MQTEQFIKYLQMKQQQSNKQLKKQLHKVSDNPTNSKLNSFNAIPNALKKSNISKQDGSKRRSVRTKSQVVQSNFTKQNKPSNFNMRKPPLSKSIQYSKVRRVKTEASQIQVIISKAPTAKKKLSIPQKFILDLRRGQNKQELSYFINKNIVDVNQKYFSFDEIWVPTISIKPNQLITKGYLNYPQNQQKLSEFIQKVHGNLLLKIQIIDQNYVLHNNNYSKLQNRILIKLLPYLQQINTTMLNRKIKSKWSVRAINVNGLDYDLLKLSNNIKNISDYRKLNSFLQENAIIQSQKHQTISVINKKVFYKLIQFARQKQGLCDQQHCILIKVSLDDTKQISILAFSSVQSSKRLDKILQNGLKYKQNQKITILSVKNLSIQKFQTILLQFQQYRQALINNIYPQKASDYLKSVIKKLKCELESRKTQLNEVKQDLRKKAQEQYDESEIQIPSQRIQVKFSKYNNKAIIVNKMLNKNTRIIS